MNTGGAALSRLRAAAAWQPAEHRAQPHDLDDRAACHVGHADANVALDAEEDRAVDAAE
jgi:hypothetical protein